MTRLYLIQLHLDARLLARGGGAAVPADPGYRVHAALAGLFGTAAPKPFAIVTPAGRPSRWLEVLGYAALDGAALLDQARSFADPLTWEGLRDGVVASRPVPAFPAGRRLGFRVRVCPTIRRRHNWRGRDDGQGAEQDVFLHAVDAVPDEHPPPPSDTPAPDREAVYRPWLEAAFARAGGVRDVSARMVDFRRERLVRRGRPDGDGHRAPHRVELPAATFEGALTVEDAAAFDALLARGLGRHRAFGFGMLLLRPPPG